jgi:aspartyl-tRNA(Asn)/glutamyl-tRNA(Gln) amidotransferase subunit A
MPTMAPAPDPQRVFIRMSVFPTISEITSDIRSGERSAVDIVRTSLDRIASIDGAINSFREVFAEEALRTARSIDERIARGEDPGPLAGVSVAIKDNIATTLGRTSAGSRLLESFRSPYTATAAQRLVDAGAIVIGKTTCDEFAMGSSNEHCAFAQTSNPWAPDRVPGGSSGGSAAAVAAGLCPAAIGSDTGGSLRQPASLCGVVGLKPTYGRVSRWGLVAFGSSLDQIGPVARTAADAAILLSAIAGHDPHDATSAELAVPDFAAQLDQPIDDLRLGVPKQYLSDANDPQVNDAVREAIEIYRSLGATTVDVDLPLTDYGIATYYILAPAEASSNLARYDGIRYGRRADLEPGEDLFDLYAKSRAEGFGPEVQRRIMLGTYVLSSGYYDQYYNRALRVRRLIKQDFDRAFERCHAIIGPTSPIPAFPMGAKTDPLTMYLCDVYTTNTNIAGICGVSIPGGFAQVNETRLPIGLQIQCPAFEEHRMLRIAHLFQQATDFHRASCSESSASPPL